MYQKQSYVDTMDEGGALEYGRLLANSLTGTYGQPLQDLISMIDKRIQEQNDHRLVLATAITDKGSSLHILGADILRMIGVKTYAEEVVLWEDVLHPYIEHDVLTTVA